MIHYLPHEAFSTTEPRIKLINDLLNMILELVNLEKDGEVVEIDGFRLKNLQDWTVPFSSLWENLGSLMPACNCNCEFCYIQDQPPLTFSRMRKPVSIDDLKVRMDNFDFEKQAGLVNALYEYGEPLAHPQFMDIVKEYRRYDPDSLISLITNGSYLTPKMLDQLEEFKPFDFSISLNSSNLDTRRRLMRDRQPDIAINAVRELPKHSFIVETMSLVAWPTISHEELKETIYFLDEHKARTIKINLPGYTRLRQNVDFSYEYWDEVIEVVQQLRKEISTPLYVSPNLYEEPHFLPIIHGIVKNSPAERAGLQFGDLILEVDGRVVTSRYQAKFFLDRKNDSLQESRRIVKIRRNGEEMLKVMTDPSTMEDDLYPFKPRGFYNPVKTGFGVMLMDSLNLAVVQQMEEYLVEFSSKNCFVIGSSLMVPIMEPYLKDLKTKFDFKTIVPQNKFFGGNIFVGDLLVVDDLFPAIQASIAQYGKPDLILLPSTMFLCWGKDLLGKTYKDLEKYFNVPVKLLMVNQIWK